MRTASANTKPKTQDFQEELKEKLRKDSAFNVYAYRVSSYTVASILKKRTELLKDKEKEETESPAQPPVPFIKPQ